VEGSKLCGASVCKIYLFFGGVTGQRFCFGPEPLYADHRDRMARDRVSLKAVPTDISNYIDCFSGSISYNVQYTDCVPFELVDTAQPLI
jgi:hypothetical protein